MSPRKTRKNRNIAGPRNRLDGKNLPPINFSRNWLVQLRPRPDTFYIGQGRAVLATALDGFVYARPGHGFFSNETRLLSHYEYRIDGESPTPVALSNVDQHTWLGYYILLPPGFGPVAEDSGSGKVTAASQNSLELKLSRYLADGLHEDVDLTNFTQRPSSFQLQLRLDADFMAIDETLGKRQQFGQKTRAWVKQCDSQGKLVFSYSASHQYRHQGEKGTAHFRCGLEVRVVKADSLPRFKGEQIQFQVDLKPGCSWHACFHLVPVIDGRPQEPKHLSCSFKEGTDEYDRLRRLFVKDSVAFVTPEQLTLQPVVAGALNQASRDLAALRLHDLDHGAHAWTVAAGLPIYLALFGRDTLSTAWQAALLSTELLQGTLPEIARWQGTEINDWRDEQPGRMIHEAHTDPLSMLNYVPRQRYYGAVTTSPFFSVALSLLWHWTGDKGLIAPLVDPALRALQWADRYGDANGDGFYDYKTRSEKGNRNQGWKDSGDAIVYDDGSQVDPPVATCEEQAFIYAAKQVLSEVLWWQDRRDEAKRLYHEASELKKRFGDAFWMEETGFYAMGLDPQSHPIKSIGSDPGHCIATGIADHSLVKRTADRMFQTDLFSGWGVRTLSSAHPAYNPYSYHRGSVWPVENATFAVGFMRYGLLSHMEQLCRAQFEAASLFTYYRLPELFSGHPRDITHPFPALYPEANWPQAWSASAVFLFLEAMLGLYPYAPLQLLFVDPQLPTWLPEITLKNLRVGQAVLTLRFYRKSNGASEYEILDQRGKLHVFRQPSPWSLRANFAERLKDLLSGFLPGK